MATEKKSIHFKAPLLLYEEFHRVFPARGEKTIFFLQVMELAVEKAEEGSKFVESVWEEAEARSKG